MVMAQIPALFLPKNKPQEKPEVKKPVSKKKKKPELNKKVSALFQGRIDGYKKDSSKTNRVGR
jgi:hypothetical protein